MANRSLVLKLVAALSAVAGIAAVAAFILWGGRLAGDEEERAALTDVPSQLDVQPGQVIRIVTEHYIRGGGALAAPTTPLPERYAQEHWIEFASRTEAIRSLTLIRDAEGNVIRESQTSPEGVAEGRTVMVNAPVERAARLSALLESGEAQIVSSTPDSIAVEFTTAYYDPFANAPSSAQIHQPYASDLEPVSLTQQVAVRADGHLRYARTYANTADGQQVLIMSTEVVLIESVGAFPSD